jgi:phage-related protein
MAVLDVSFVNTMISALTSIQTTITNSVTTMNNAYSAVMLETTGFVNMPNFGVKTNPPVFPGVSAYSITWPSAATGDWTSTLDLCHLQINTSTSILDVMMAAISMIVDSMINLAKKTINDAVKMFMHIINFLDDVWFWMKQVCKVVNKGIGDMYNQCFDSKKQAESAGDTVKANQWSNLLEWVKNLWGKIKGLLSSLVEATKDVIEAIGDARDYINDTIWPAFSVSFGNMVKDFACMTKAATSVYE